jgi:hypothetical protein
MAKDAENLTSHIRALLDHLVACRQLSNDEQEVVGDEVMAERRILVTESCSRCRAMRHSDSELDWPSGSYVVRPALARMPG